MKTISTRPGTKILLPIRADSKNSVVRTGSALPEQMQLIADALAENLC